MCAIAVADDTETSRPAPTATSLPRGSRSLGEENLRPLFERWQQDGDRHAREVLLQRFLPLARSLARRYLGTQEPIEDLTQVACLGLIKSIDRFDGDRGNHFAAYAVPTILGELRRHFRDTTWVVHVPRSGQERALEVERAGEILSAKRGHSPTVTEIAQYLECDQEQVLDALQVAQARNVASLDAPRASGGEEDMEPRGAGIGTEDEGFALIEDGSAVAQALALLAPRARLILRLRFQQEMTQSEIAEQVGLSQMQISRILRQALEQMRAVASRAAPALRG